MIETSVAIGSSINAQSIAEIGNGSFQPRRLMIADADTFENHGIDYYINDLMKYAGKKGRVDIDGRFL
jgi:hypothetical protein